MRANRMTDGNKLWRREIDSGPRGVGQIDKSLLPPRAGLTKPVVGPRTVPLQESDLVASLGRRSMQSLEASTILTEICRIITVSL